MAWRAKLCHSIGSPEIIHDQKTAAHHIFAQPVSFRRGQFHVTHLNGIKKRVAEELRIHDRHCNILLQHNADIREPIDSKHELFVRFGPICPPGTTAPAGETRQTGTVNQTRKNEFRTIGTRVSDDLSARQHLCREQEHETHHWNQSLHFRLDAIEVVE